jgi:cell division septum initiation protein DivIVA
MAANIDQANALIGELKDTIKQLQQQNKDLQQQINTLIEELDLQHDRFYDV